MFLFLFNLDASVAQYFFEIYKLLYLITLYYIASLYYIFEYIFKMREVS